MPLSFDYDETRALAKQFRELTGRDIKHTQIIEAMATIKGMKADSLMHMLKTEGQSRAASGTTRPTEHAFLDENDLTESLRRAMTIPHDPRVILHHLIGVFEMRPDISCSSTELGEMQRAVRNALSLQAISSRVTVGFLDSQHFVIAFPNVINIDAVPNLFDTVLTSVPKSVLFDGNRLSFRLIGAVANVPDADHLNDALTACKGDIPEFFARIPASNTDHDWDIVEDWE